MPLTLRPFGDIMASVDYDDPDVEERWCHEQRQHVADYLQSEHVEHGHIGEWPAWHIAPYVAVWAIESLKHPEWIGWWAISGDLPTDHVSAADCEPPQHPRKAVRAIAERWREAASAWSEGREYEAFSITNASSHQELAPLLASRADLLIEWAEDESLWEEE